MKKVVLAIGVISFLILGAISINNVEAFSVNKAFYDDPPKKEVKNDKDCSKSCASAKSCCDSKSTSKAQTESKDKEATKSTNTSTSTATTAAKKDNPDKK
ncbi:MAG: hypothetical protein JW731_02085 [Bacteroidales bacterium]|nr:hypothetical protein [Bacteroidales bacterium]